jgi:transposase
MGRKSSEVPIAERKLIYKLHMEGKSYLKIANLVNRSKSAIQYVIKNIKTNGDVVNKQRKGGPRKLTTREEKAVIREIKKEPRISGPKLAAFVLRYFNKQVSAETCRRILRRENFHGKVARKKPFINKKNRMKRLQFAKQYIDKDFNF